MLRLHRSPYLPRALLGEVTSPSLAWRSCVRGPDVGLAYDVFPQQGKHARRFPLNVPGALSPLRSVHPDQSTHTPGVAFLPGSAPATSPTLPQLGQQSLELLLPPRFPAWSPRSPPERGEEKVVNRLATEQLRVGVCVHSPDDLK